MATGKKRATFFTNLELEILMRSYGEFQHVFKKKCNTAAAANERQTAWESIAARVNACNPAGEKRTWQQLKMKYKNIVQSVNRKKADARKTCGGPAPPPLKEAEEPALNHNTGRPVAEGIPGGSSSSESTTQDTSAFIKHSDGAICLIEPPHATTHLVTDEEDEETASAACTEGDPERPTESMSGQQQEGPSTSTAQIDTLTVKEVYQIHLLKKVLKYDKEMLYLDRQIRKADLEIEILEHKLEASNGCSEEMARLLEREKYLKSQLQKQELLLRRLQLLSRPDSKDQVRVDQSQDTQHRDCSQVFSSGSKSSGSYRIKLNRRPSPIKVYCDMSDGGGWTVMQRRINGSETFNRSWAEYKEGFGDIAAEFWLGNDNLHHITAQGSYSLRIYLEDFDGNQRYADYENVKVADEKDHYRLTFGAYAGTAGDSFSGNYQFGVADWASHQGMKFSTYDQDNDNYTGNCAQEDKGGWWFNKCHSANLNGLYYPRGHYSALTDDGVVWYTWRGWWYSLKTSVMKLRPTDFRIDPIDDPNAVHRSPPS
ncbi:fibrinogen-like protein 1 [Mugil cephalus]|uniref:fibrinogen-like protein 1 n=1 Tax=Mugil cephalus TaxID=48193 RepID=UPI001FB7A46A|nr:fibrinogen-like protein 1 [Mugil cephalus]